MFFKKKLTGLAVALLASSSVVFGQFLQTIPDSSNVSQNITHNGNLNLGGDLLYPSNSSMSIRANNWNGPALKLEPKWATLSLYNNSSFSINTLQQEQFPTLFYVNNNGNVGIGTNNPEEKLHVKGGNIVLEGKTKLQQVSSTKNAYINYAGLTIKSPLGATDVNDFKIESQIVENGTVGNIRPLSMGYVGGEKIYFRHNQIDITKLNVENYLLSNQIAIGTTLIPQGYKLAIDGKMICEAVRVEMSENWPDYVFQPNYKLNSLEEVEEHIEENGHLPNIPSQEEVMNNGIDLGEMQKLQMEKIEELTLYLIEQNKKMKALEDELQALKKQ